MALFDAHLVHSPANVLFQNNVSRGRQAFPVRHDGRLWRGVAAADRGHELDR